MLENREGRNKMGKGRQSIELDTGETGGEGSMLEREGERKRCARTGRRSEAS